MSNFSIFEIAGSAMSAQTVRLNTVASNMANAETASSTPEGVYRPIQPIFQTVLDEAGRNAGGVRVTGIVKSQAPAIAEYAPNHPLANEQGYIYRPNINLVEEMANMMSASRSYQNNVDMLSTVKQLMLRTLQLGQQ